MRLKLFLAITLAFGIGWNIGFTAGNYAQYKHMSKPFIIYKKKRVLPKRRDRSKPSTKQPRQRRPHKYHDGYIYEV